MYISVYFLFWPIFSTTIPNIYLSPKYFLLFQLMTLNLNCLHAIFWRSVLWEEAGAAGGLDLGQLTPTILYFVRQKTWPSQIFSWIVKSFELISEQKRSPKLEYIEQKTKLVPLNVVMKPNVVIFNSYKLNLLLLHDTKRLELRIVMRTRPEFSRLLELNF